MGLGSDVDVAVDDGDGIGAGGYGGAGGKLFGSVSCSICLEVVAFDNRERSWATLQCGHQFHLDCIGSAFNIKGAMQCPNCRKIEKGQWLYANGCRSFPEFNMEDWTHDEDLYDLSFSEMSFGVHWCPFGSLTRLASSFEEGEFSSTAYHDLLGQHAIFAEHTAVSSASHPCPYIAYFGPVHPSSSNSSSSVSESSIFNNHWNVPSVPNEMPTPYAFPAVDLHYQSWDHHSPPFSANGNRMGDADQPAPPVTQRSARANSELMRSGYYMRPSGPFFVGHSSGPRAGSSATSSMVPPYPGSTARSRDRVQALQAYYQQQPSNVAAMRPPAMSSSRRSHSHRAMAPSGPMAQSPDQSSGFYFFPSGSSGRIFQEPENPVPTHFHSWDRDHLPSFSSNQLDREPVWGPLHQSAGVSSDPSIRSSSFRQRHGSDRTSTQNR